MNDPTDHANVRFPPPLLYLGALIIGLVTGWILHVQGFGSYRMLSVWAGGVLTILGIALVVTAAGLFRKMGTNVQPSQPSTSLVSTGLYRISRNPMYLGMALLYAGLALLLESIVALILLPAVLVIIQTQVIVREERYLEARFGDDYVAYKGRVRRWL